MSDGAGRLRLLHLHSSFDRGGKELRAARLMNAFGPDVWHTVISSQPKALSAREALGDRIRVDYPTGFPPLSGKPLPGRLQRLARAMSGFDLVLTYNWGAMDAVLAHTLFSSAFAMPPLVHHEDGFNKDEAVRLKPSRNWYRRVALGRASALIVPSRQLERIALEVWQQPAGRVRRIANGIDTDAYGRKPKRNALPRVIKRPGELWVGSIAGLRPVKNLPRLVRVVAQLDDAWQLVILGEGTEREAIRAEAVRLGIGHRVHLPGFIADPANAIGLFDVFALSSDSEQFPLSVVEAMAAGLAVAATDVGDIRDMVAEPNRPFLARASDERALAEALLRLSSDTRLRQSIGAANKARARAEFDASAMVEAYRRVYAEVLRRPAFP